MPVEFAPRQHETEEITAHVIWMTTGLSCDGDSVGMTSATNPSLEDIITGAIPGMPKVIVHNPVLAFEQGDEFMQAWYDAEAGKLDPFVLILEGSLPNEKLSGNGYFAALGNNHDTGQPITTTEWVDRLAPKAAAVVAVGGVDAEPGPVPVAVDLLVPERALDDEDERVELAGLGVVPGLHELRTDLVREHRRVRHNLRHAGDRARDDVLQRRVDR